MADTTMVGCAAITVGFVTRVYGGPEEGGWWYDAFDPTRVFVVRRARRERLRALLDLWLSAVNEGRRELSSVLSTGRYELRSGVEPATELMVYQ